jgi:hypothetical protein
MDTTNAVCEPEVRLTGRRAMKKSPYDLRKARKEVGLTVARASALAKVGRKVWEKWEFSPESPSYHCAPSYIYQFLRFYQVLKKHNLLSEIEGSQE